MNEEQAGKRLFLKIDKINNKNKSSDFILECVREKVSWSISRNQSWSLEIYVKIKLL